MSIEDVVSSYLVWIVEYFISDSSSKKEDERDVSQVASQDVSEIELVQFV